MPHLNAFQDSSTDLPLPWQVWMPERDASICIYWDRTPSGGFSIALQLIDPRLLGAGDPGIMLRNILSRPGRVQVPYSLTDDEYGIVISVRFALRTDAAGVDQLWLLDARYPGGHTVAAQISDVQA